ncbi:MAG: hypothetical protein AAFO94_02615, partial [Bacteroidota bacterium]
MKRRHFVQKAALGSLAIHLPMWACNGTQLSPERELDAYQQLSYDLLKTWCDAMIRDQLRDTDDPSLYGALYCHACEKIHGRCMDAVYPFMYMASATGEQKYIDAAIDVMQWSENVSRPDGSWTVIPNPKSWRGITVFGAIALAEALHHHGNLLPTGLHEKWRQRLSKAAEFIHLNFTIDYSHINYAFTAVYALNLLGRMFDNTAYLEHSHALAREIPNWLTHPKLLLFGENQPMKGKSKKGLLPVDLGYNVEETINGMVQYAVMENDENLLQLLSQSMESHLAFMLPDGAWDNSWGTRQNKWSYWGSRTTDGCQPAFSLMAKHNPAFATAAYCNTELLQRCTVDGLLAGGLHYDDHGVKPCIHHTFAHAKSLAFVLDNKEQIGAVRKTVPLPRSTANGLQHFPEIDVWLAARGPWRATVSTYDAVFKKQYSQAATGGSLAVLWHDPVGPIFTASMAEYLLAEANNQQLQPDGEDIPLTPRIELTEEGSWYSNLFDLEATAVASDDGTQIQFDIKTQLTNREGVVSLAGVFTLTYRLSANEIQISATRPISQNATTASLVLPIISP